MKQLGWFNDIHWSKNNPCDPAQEWLPCYVDDTGTFADNYEPIGFMLPNMENRDTGQIEPVTETHPSSRNAKLLYRFRYLPPPEPADELQEQLNAARECIEILNKRVIELTARADNMDLVTAYRAMEVGKLAARFDDISQVRTELNTYSDRLNRIERMTIGSAVPEHFHADMTGKPRPEPGLHNQLYIGQRFVIAGCDVRVYQIDVEPNGFRVTFK